MDNGRVRNAEIAEYVGEKVKDMAGNEVAPSMGTIARYAARIRKEKAELARVSELEAASQDVASVQAIVDRLNRRSSAIGRLLATPELIEVTLINQKMLLNSVLHSEAEMDKADAMLSGLREKLKGLKGIERQKLEDRVTFLEARNRALKEDFSAIKTQLITYDSVEYARLKAEREGHEAHAPPLLGVTEQEFEQIKSLVEKQPQNSRDLTDIPNLNKVLTYFAKSKNDKLRQNARKALLALVELDIDLDEELDAESREKIVNVFYVDSQNMRVLDAVMDSASLEEEGNLARKNGEWLSEVLEKTNELSRRGKEIRDELERIDNLLENTGKVQTILQKADDKVVETEAAVEKAKADGDRAAEVDAEKKAVEARAEAVNIRKKTLADLWIAMRELLNNTTGKTFNEIEEAFNREMEKAEADREIEGVLKGLMEERKNDLLLGRKDEEGVRSGGLRELQEEMGVAGTKGLLGNFDQDKVPNVILDVQTSISNMNDGTNTIFNTTLPKKLRTLIADAGRLLREEKADLGVTDKGDKSLEGRLNTMDKLEEVLRKGVQLGESQEKAERSKLRKNLPKATAEVFEVMRNMEEAGIQTDITVESLTELMDTFKDEDFILRFYGELMPKIAEQVRKLYEIVNEKGETEKLSRETIQGLINTIQGKIYGASKEYVHSMSMEEKKAWSNWTNQLSAAEGYDIETQVDAEISSLMDDITKEGGIELVAAIDNRLAELDSNIKKVQGQIKSREQELKKLKDKLAGPRDRDGNLLDDRGRPVQPNTIRQWR
ncbi:MAG: hypothetical protein WBD12_05215, partial [Candidatus Omnitrophota bacterium]